MHLTNTPPRGRRGAMSAQLRLVAGALAVGAAGCFMGSGSTTEFRVEAETSASRFQAPIAGGGDGVDQPQCILSLAGARSDSDIGSLPAPDDGNWNVLLNVVCRATPSEPTLVLGGFPEPRSVTSERTISAVVNAALPISGLAGAAACPVGRQVTVTITPEVIWEESSDDPAMKFVRLRVRAAIPAESCDHAIEGAVDAVFHIRRVDYKTYDYS